VDRNFVNIINLVCTARTFNVVSRYTRTLDAIFLEKGYCLPIDDMLQIEDKIRIDTIAPFLSDIVAWNVLIFEYDTSDVDSIGMRLRARRDRIVPGLKTGDGGDDEIKWNTPGSGVVRGRNSRGVISSGKLKDFTKFKATVCNNPGVDLFVGIKVFQERLSLGIGCVLRQRTEDLATSNSADIDVVAKNGAVGSWDREWYFSESRI